MQPAGAASRKSYQERGLTLLSVLAAVAIAAVLSVVGLSQFEHDINHAKETTAEQSLTAATLQMQGVYSQVGAFNVPATSSATSFLAYMQKHFHNVQYESGSVSGSNGANAVALSLGTGANGLGVQSAEMAALSQNGRCYYVLMVQSPASALASDPGQGVYFAASTAKNNSSCTASTPSSTPPTGSVSSSWTHSQATGWGAGYQ